jgi:hypothetical protein
LTIVCNRWLDRIGGRKRIGSQLDESSTSVREYRDGLIIQAGPSPQIGDRNRNNLLDPYRDVARLLKPLRMHFPEMQSLLDLGDGRETEVTNEWLARFD